MSTTLLQLLGEGAVIGAHLVSLHSSPSYITKVDVHGNTLEQRDYETVTPGVYARLRNGATFGAFRNSYGRGSAYLGYTFETADGRFALTVGGVTGYHGAAVQPLVIPSMQFGLDALGAPGWKARIALAPKPPRQAAAAAVHFAVEVAL